jgi:hypothetical protein
MKLADKAISGPSAPARAATKLPQSKSPPLILKAAAAIAAAAQTITSPAARRRFRRALFLLNVFYDMAYKKT